MAITAILQTKLTQVSGDGFRFDISNIYNIMVDAPIRAIIPASSTNAFVCGAIDVSAVTLCIILTSKSCTIKTNSSGSPANTINMVENKPYIWDSAAPYDAFLLTVDVTGLYITTTDETQVTIYTVC